MYSDYNPNSNPNPTMDSATTLKAHDQHLDGAALFSLSHDELIPLGIAAVAVRCAFFDRNLHPRMLLDPTHVRLKLLHACDQWHSSRKFTLLPVDTVNFVQTLKEQDDIVHKIAQLRLKDESTVPSKWEVLSTVRCSVLDRNFHWRMPLVLTPVQLNAFEVNMRVTNGIPLGSPLLLPLSS
jgi:hypothetical protein